MQALIEELWRGHMEPRQKCGEDDPEIQELLRLLEQNGESLGEMLSEKQRERFEKYTDCVEEYLDLMTLSAFRDGFCLGGKLFTAALLL